VTSFGEVANLEQYIALAALWSSAVTFSGVTYYSMRDININAALWPPTYDLRCVRRKRGAVTPRHLSLGAWGSRPTADTSLARPVGFALCCWL